MGQIIYRALFLFLSFLLCQCAPSRSSYFGENDWQAVSEDDKPVSFSQIDKEMIALNVYAPNCVPCWKEIPTLNYLNAEILSKFPKLALYMVVDPYQIVEDLPPESSWGVAFKKAKEIMGKEKKDRNILLPILYMKPPFQVKISALVTGTPETLLFETKPLRLYYNFIGAISEETNAEDIKNSPKVHFFRHQFGMIGL